MYQSEDLKRNLVEALLRLNGMSKNKAALSLDLKRQNLYNWLSGVDTAISNTKKLELLEMLGVKGGQLSTDRIHRWCIHNIEDARLVISAMTAKETKPQELFILGIWPANDFDAVLRLTTGNHHHTYLLLYYPPTDKPPLKITADSLGLGTQMKSIVAMTKEQWTNWLSPDVVDQGLITRTIDFEIQNNSTAEGVDAEDTDDSHDASIAALEPPTATVEQTKRWNTLLDQALMTGRSFEQVLAETKQALNIYSFGELRAMQKKSFKE